MTRLLPAAVLISLGSVVVARTPEPSPPSYVQTLTVSPAPSPTPALRYELLPRLRDRTPGNAALEYRRAALLLPAWPRDPEAGRRQSEQIGTWLGAPVEKLPVAEVRKFLSGYSGSFRALDAAARCTHSDWQLTGKLSAEYLDAHLTEVQKYREVARFQQLRIRADLADNRFDDAARGLATGFRLGKDVAEGPTLIQMLVGIAITSVFTGEVDRWLERPGAPNLYWAVTTLPHPFIDPRKALEGEAAFSAATFPELTELEKGPVSAELANRTLENLLRAFRPKGPAGAPPGLERTLGQFGLFAYAALHHPEAKKELLAMGRPPEEVEKMPPAQVVALRAILGYRAMWDDQVKCFSLPYPQATAELARLREKATKNRKSSDSPLSVFALLLPATEKVYHAYARTDRRFAGLRAVEAVRMHAAAHGGSPPRDLAAVTLVPVPDDPNTGKPFEYAVEGNTFTLTAPPPDGEKPNASNCFRYVVTVRGE